MMPKILIALAAIACVLVIALRPSDFHTSRRLVISAPAEVLFDQVNDLHRFQTWNPWARIDPDAKITYSGPASGVDASYHWAGNHEVGEGSMTAIESRPPELVRFRMDFRKPMAGTSVAEFTFKPDGDKTEVTWSMSGTNHFLAKAVGLFIDCDKMIGDQFEKGLANLAEIVKHSPNS